MSAPIVVDYDPEWPHRAAALIEELHAALRPEVRRIEHIGSTAVPGMASKPVLDVQASVDDLEAIEARFDAALEPLGFTRTPYDRDHVPTGRDDDPGHWAKRMWMRRPPSGSDVNLHVRVVGSPNERLALLFRDWMRAHPDAVAAYVEFKRALAAQMADVGVYSDVKDPVVDVVIVAAGEWASATGWSP